MFRTYPTEERRDMAFNNMMRLQRSWAQAFTIRRSDLKYWTIHVPGWGTVYGRGTREQADRVAQLRQRAGRGEPQILEVNKPDNRIEWRDLAAILGELQK